MFAEKIIMPPAMLKLSSPLPHFCTNVLCKLVVLVHLLGRLYKIIICLKLLTFLLFLQVTKYLQSITRLKPYQNNLSSFADNKCKRQNRIEGLGRCCISMTSARKMVYVSCNLMLCLCFNTNEDSLLC